MEIKKLPVKIKTKKNNKNKIILLDSYNTGLNHIFLRHSLYKNIPHFSILKNGEIYKHLEIKDSPYHIEDGIYVALENLGPLEKVNDNLFKSMFAIYTKVAFEKQFRGNFFYDYYHINQFESLIYLINSLPIKKNIIDSNFVENNIKSFEGICCRANFDEKYLDVNPNFSFEFLKTLL